MPFDPILPTPPTGGLVRRDRVAIAVWLFVVCAMLLVMISLGGATRLTGSGLSIMEWAPLAGTWPPTSQAEWERLFALYRAIPQYALLHDGFGLEGFKDIFWLEWVHRFWGRLIGFAFAIPAAVFWFRGSIGPRLLVRFVVLLGVGALQGAVGWFMVASGFAPDATEVAPVRLVLHLLLALALYSAILWTAFAVLQSAVTPVRLGRSAIWLASLLVLAVLTIIAGGFVAGLHAGLTYNTFPLMDGHLIPAGYAALAHWPANLVANVAAVQFNHRLLASTTLLFAAAAVWRNWPNVPLRPALAAIAGTVILQYGLGVATLLQSVPVWLGTLHQSGAVLLLTAAIAGLFRASHAHATLLKVGRTP